ncbi:hypothetical protein BT69DRAFT_1352153 [Atractiella rhizophila]|nr:hypothetical protein BT69DRAFT_1352153 [Atractiella rhizophila]
MARTRQIPKRTSQGEIKTTKKRTHGWADAESRPKKRAKRSLSDSEASGTDGQQSESEVAANVIPKSKTRLGQNSSKHHEPESKEGKQKRRADDNEEEKTGTSFLPLKSQLRAGSGNTRHLVLSERSFLLSLIKESTAAFLQGMRKSKKKGILESEMPAFLTALEECLDDILLPNDVDAHHSTRDETEEVEELQKQLWSETKRNQRNAETLRDFVASRLAVEADEEKENEVKLHPAARALIYRGLNETELEGGKITEETVLEAMRLRKRKYYKPEEDKWLQGFLEGLNV